MYCYASNRSYDQSLPSPYTYCQDGSMKQQHDLAFLTYTVSLSLSFHLYLGISVFVNCFWTYQDNHAVVSCNFVVTFQALTVRVNFIPNLFPRPHINIIPSNK